MTSISLVDRGAFRQNSLIAIPNHLATVAALRLAEVIASRIQRVQICAGSLSVIELM